MNATIQRLITGYLFIFLSSCTTVKVHNHILMDEDQLTVTKKHQSVVTSDLHEIEPVTHPSRDVIECRNKNVIKLDRYVLPDIPDIDTVPLSDELGEVKLLLDHIAELRADLKIIVKEYKCNPN